MRITLTILLLATGVAMAAQAHAKGKGSSSGSSSSPSIPSGKDSGTTVRHFKNCSEARAAGAAPIRRGEPGYAPHLDRDNDGIACEPYRKAR